MTFLPFYKEITVLEKKQIVESVVEKKQRTARSNRRYYLHQKIKSSVKYNARTKTIYLAAGTDETEPIKELSTAYQYAIQTFIQ